MEHVDADFELSLPTVSVTVPVGLEERILARIALARRRRAIMFAGVQTTIALLSAGSVVEAVRYTLGEAYLSGFTEYVSLAFSGRGTLVGAWQQFFLTLGESLPVVSLILVCAALFALIWSGSRAAHNFKSLRIASA